MRLEARYSSEEAIPEGLRDYYVEQDGRWILNDFVESETATKLLEQNASLKRQLDDARFKRIAFQTAIEAGAPSAAIPDVATRIENSYEMRDGQVVPRDPTAPRSLEAFVDQLRTDASHLFDAAAAA